MKELEEEGAKSDVKRKVRDGGEREMRQLRDRTQRGADRLDEIWTTFTKLAPKQLIIDENLYREIIDRYGEYFEGAMGAESIQKLIETFDIDAEAEILRDTIRNGKGQKKLRALKRLKVVVAFQMSGNSPMGMVLNAVPVIPPELRPMVQLDGGRFATSDLNDLYRRVINRNNRLKRLIDLGAPEIIVNNEKRMLQESVDALFDNGRGGRRHRAGQPPAQVAVRSAQGQAGPVPPEPARQACGLFRSLRYCRWPAAQAAPVRSAQADGPGAVQAVRDEATG